MGVPFWQSLAVGRYVLGQTLRRRKRYPLVLMLEPLFRCNLECAGCGKIQYPKPILDRTLSVEECAEAARECGAPVVSIAGGEPLLHPQIGEIAEALVAQRRYLYLCTNAIQLKKKLSLFTPSRYLTFSVHIDGLEASHDHAVCREGIYRIAIEAIRAAKEAGFNVTTNTTVFAGADPDELREMFDVLTELGVDGMMISPGYSYEKAPDQEHFLRRERTADLFKQILGDADRRWQFNHSPLFLRFLAGERHYECTPWGNPTRNVFGWQRPCYLLDDGYAETFQQLMEETEWDRYGTGREPRCADCMVHSGYEASAVVDATRSLSGGLAMAWRLLFGPGIRRPPEADSADGAPTAGAVPAPRVACGSREPAEASSGSGLPPIR